MKSPLPEQIKYLQKDRILEIAFTDGINGSLPGEYLRAYSPSAENQGHGQPIKPRKLKTRAVNVIAIEPVGNYAVRFIFDDGHNSGIYSFVFLYELTKNFSQLWEDYLQVY